MARRSVVLGQQYRRLAGSLTPSIWQVQRIYNDQRGVSHTIVVNVSDTTNKKTLATSALLDRKRFELIPGEILE